MNGSLPEGTTSCWGPGFEPCTAEDGPGERWTSFECRDSPAVMFVHVQNGVINSGFGEADALNHNSCGFVGLPECPRS